MRRAPIRSLSPTPGGAAILRRWRRCAPGRRPFVRLDVLHRENLEALLPEFAIDPATVPASELDALSLVWRRLDPWPDSVSGLTRLKRGFIVAPLSNGNIRLMLRMAGLCECLAVGGALPALDRRQAEDELANSLYSEVPAPERELLALVHTMLSRGLVAEEELARRMRAVRSRLESD